MDVFQPALLEERAEDIGQHDIIWPEFTVNPVEQPLVPGSQLSGLLLADLLALREIAGVEDLDVGIDENPVDRWIAQHPGGVVHPPILHLGAADIEEFTITVGVNDGIRPVDAL